MKNPIQIKCETFRVKCKISNKDDFDYLYNASNEYGDYYNSMLNTLRIDYEIKSQRPKNCRTFIDRYELQKMYSAKRMNQKPKYLMSWQIINASDELYNAIKSFYDVRKTIKTAQFPHQWKKFNDFKPLFFSFQKTSRNIRILNEQEIELTFQNKRKIILKCYYDKNHKLSELKLRPEGHKLIYDTVNDDFYFHFCRETNKLLPVVNKSLYIDPGQEDLVTGFCPEDKEILIVSGKPLNNKKLIKRREEIQSLRDKKRYNSIRNKKLNRTLKRLNRKIKNQKHTYLHKISKYIVTNYDTIVIGDLKGIKENTKSQCHETNKNKFELWPIGIFTNQLDYKSQNSTNRFFAKQEEYNTTKECCVCGHSKEMTLKDRTYHCDRCGNELPRDTNSSINIYDKFLQLEPKLFSSDERVTRSELIEALKTTVLRVM